MILAANATDGPVIGTVLEEFIDGAVGAVPRLVSGVIFLLIAYLAIRIVRSVARSALSRIYPLEEALIVDLTVAIISVFLWFGTLLALLDIVGMGPIAASLGTATGFVGLGVAFALKEMIADTVAGVYLLQDPDFQAGDRVTTASVTGTVERIDLRKTRVRLDDGDLVVLANREVEKKWTKEAEETDTGAESGSPDE
jgi:small-conductance mechanosensitive channel